MTQEVKTSPFFGVSGPNNDSFSAWDALGALKRSKYDPLGPKSGQESGKNGQKRVFFGLSEA